ncbi:Anti-sigma regulatory factor (Ser/Thr protein kinase) [Dyadobacter soli]|uniref:Anti-sigma regulatory factor (Ser/Thr protein kinase) n=1 Tax=Dyadobacter soli TaxID=659014 RepID=A0A1G7SFT5_9BACT|nr:ATP-binding SpoIIE family protein phosphatase [Dyadobacter soli]SDG21289.1 Anti-sigma regulatory factor (Ser/Thr protein kinase) [Dyadobacter soli]
MDSVQQVNYDFKDRSFLPIIKKDAQRMGTAAGLPAKRLAEMEIVLSEIATNLLKHAGSGEIIVRVYNDSVVSGIEIMGIDNGPGIADPGKMMEDGMSTTGTLGHGLGAIRRLSDQFQLYTLPGWGTVLLARIFQSPPVAGTRPPRWGIYPIVVPKPGETYCGDMCVWKSNPYFIKVLMADGLGHGILAQQASEKAAEAFQKSTFNTPHQILMEIHQHVKNTRGLVATIAVYDLTNKVWLFCGVGNISTRLHDAISSKTYLPYNGIVGVNIPRVLESQTVPAEPGRHLIMCSDGISSRWDASKHIGAFRCDPSVLAAAIYKDFARHSDDTSVTVVKVS